MLGLLLHPEDGGDAFLLNVGEISPDYIVLYQKTEFFISAAVGTSDPIRDIQRIDIIYVSFDVIDAGTLRSYNPRDLIIVKLSLCLTN
jgi:hypothetical protein